jgi:hypothetical protein
MWHNTFETEPYNTRALYFYEPINTTAPHDESCHPYCCLINTIVFYKYPYTPNDRGGYQEWDHVETQFDNYGQRFTDEDWDFQSVAPFVVHDGKIYEIATGQVIWRNDSWYMRWLGWLVDESDRRWPYIKDKPGEK